MAFVVATKRGNFEVRESRSTDSGPRSRTLATFQELDEETIAKARSRAENPPTPEELRAAALRAGAPVAGTPANEAARDLLRLSNNGERIDPKLRLLLLDSLADDTPGHFPTNRETPVSDAARAATEWIGASSKERAKTLWDLLELVDALPVRRRPPEIAFPRLGSS